MRPQLALLVAALAAGAAAGEPLPVVLFHGMGDSANSEGMTAVRERIVADTGACVVSVYVGKPGDDVRSGFFGRVTEQLADVCAEQLLSDPRLLASGFNAVGFSQGGLFLRALAQTCDVRVHTLVTLGSPHGGVAQVPACSAGDGVFCKSVARLVKSGAYTDAVQGSVVQAQYFRAANDEAAFLQHSLFLAAANNLLDAKNATYAQRLAALDRLVLFRFTDDATVVPRDSAWFAMQSGDEVVPLEEQELYAKGNDWLGLRALHDSGRLTLAECPGEHMRFTLDWFAENVIHPYLRDGSAPETTSSSWLERAAASCASWLATWRRSGEASAAPVSRRVLRQ
jgi:palmitoyl-protein thioesterase